MGHGRGSTSRGGAHALWKATPPEMPRWHPPGWPGLLRTATGRADRAAWWSATLRTALGLMVGW